MMDEFDQHTSLHEDWLPDSPDPIIFSSVTIDDISSKYAPEIPLDINFDKDQNLSFSTEENFTSEGFERENGSDDLDLPKARREKLLERVKASSAFSLSISLSDISVIKDSFSQYLKTPPVISPRSFLDSPTFLSNTLVQPSPTTGKMPFNKNCTFGVDDSTSFFDDFGSSTFESKPIEDSDSSFFPGDTSIVPMEFSVGSSENTILETMNDDTILETMNDDTILETMNDDTILETMNDDTILGGASNSLPLDEHHHQQQEDEEQRTGGNVMVSTSAGEDGYNWRKYGQKQVKCSDYPRSYYKCTHPNCPVKKKVERSFEGLVTEIIYEKAHNHPEPVPNRKLTFGSSNHPTDVQLDPHNENRSGVAANSNLQAQINGVDHGLTSNLSNINKEGDHNQQGGSGGLLGYGGEEDEQESKRRKIEASYATDQMSGATRAIRMPRVVLQATSEIDILEDGYRWRKYGQKVVKGNPNPRSYYKCTSANCPVRKHVERASHDLGSVITTYEGKHNHLVPAARNSSSSSSHVNSANQSVSHSAVSSVQSHQHHLLHRVDPYQVQNEMLRFNRPYAMTGRQLIGHPNEYTSFGMNQGLGTNLVGMGGMSMGMGMDIGMGMGMGSMRMGMGVGGMNMDMDMAMGMNMGMGGMSMGGLGSTNQGNMSVLPALPNYLGQQNQMGMMMPKGEPILESSMNNIINNNNNIANGSSSSSSTSSASSVYHQIMNRVSPVGPQI